MPSFRILPQRIFFAGCYDITVCSHYYEKPSFSVEFVSGDLSLQSEEISEYLDGMGGNTERIKGQLTLH